MEWKQAETLTWDAIGSCSHPTTLRNVALGSLDPGVDAAEWNHDLEMSVERRTAEPLTLDMQTRYGRIGDLKKLKERLDELTLESRIPGETWRDVEDHGWVDAWVAINKDMPVRRDPVTWRASHANGQTFAFTSLKYYSNRTHSFATTFLLDLAKYIHWLLYYPFYPLPHSVYGGVLEL